MQYPAASYQLTPPIGHVGSWHPTKAFSTWDLRVNFGLDSFGLDSYRGITGVDAQDCVPQLSAKMGDSVARANGRSGCIVEQYMGRGSGSGTSWAGHWGLTLEELRAQAIRLHLAGARQFLFHGFRFEVMRRNRNQITLVRVTPPKKPAKEEAAKVA